MRFQGFIGPSYQLSSKNVDTQRCINLYPQMSESGTSKSGEVAFLMGTPGLQTLATIGDGPYRGMCHTTSGRLFVVVGNKLYEVDSSWTATELGTLSTSVGVVSIAASQFEIMLVDGPYGYEYVFETEVFAQITDPDFLGADQVVWQDGYFIFNVPGEGKIMHTGLNSTAIDALDMSTVEGSPDDVVGLISNHRDLWLFGTRSVEVFFNSGDANTVFQRIEGAFVEQGCIAKWSIQKMKNDVYWLGSDETGAGIVYRAQGYQPQRISTHAVEFAIRQYANLEDSVAWSYQENGHFFYVLNFPSAQTTWVFDATTGLWHERAYTFEGVFQRHRAQFHAYIFGKHVVCDYENGKLYEMSSSIYSDDGEELRRQRVSPHVSGSRNRLFYDALELEMEAGTGLDGEGQGVDPQAILEFSDDGGHTWSNEKWAGFGRIGQRKKRCKWRRLGQSRDRVFRVTITDPVKVVIIGAELTIRQGAS